MTDTAYAEPFTKPSEPESRGMRTRGSAPISRLETPRCRFSGRPLSHTFVDLGASPIANNNLCAEDLTRPEKFYPLHVWVAEDSFLVQLEELDGATATDIFNPDYVYFSSYSESWLAHAKRYCEAMIQRCGLGGRHQVIEVASNDGYLLR